MAIEIQNGEESQVVEAEPFGVRIDLGEIRLSLEMLTALRAGTAIELDTTFPTECYLRIGATTLAKGMVRSCDSGLTIDIEEVFS
jgi:flagellar motor switch/type III secretory pathway protein FliN